MDYYWKSSFTVQSTDMARWVQYKHTTVVLKTRVKNFNVYFCPENMGLSCLISCLIFMLPKMFIAVVFYR